jgi:pimeloyl-ACP methyl ester carboxylesterase
MVGLLYPPCSAGGRTPGDYGLRWEAVTLQARAGGEFRGFLIPGTNRAGVIMPPGYANGADGRLGEAAVLARHGYTVLTFESRRCAGMGAFSLGYKEVDEVADALAYLQTRPEVDPARIGVYGFSSAGATAVMATARLPDLKAVVAEGGYSDFVADTLHSDNSGSLVGDYFLSIFIPTTHLTYRLVTGLDINQLSPLDVIGQIAPRPILLIYGSREMSLAGGRRQEVAAGPNAELWVVPGAGHGNYLAMAPVEYERRLVAFFEGALLYPREK